MNRSAIAVAVVLIIGLCAVAHGAILARLAAADPILISAFRTGVATLIILPIGLALYARSSRRIDWASLRWPLLGGVALAAHFASWIASLDHTSIANSVVLVNTSPVWLALYTLLVRRERLGPMALAGVGLSIVGSLVIGLFAPDQPDGGDSLYGDALALAGGICMAIYLLIGRRALGPAAADTSSGGPMPLLLYLGLCYGSAAVVLWVAVLAGGIAVVGLSQTSYLAMVGAGLVSQVIGHSAYNWSLLRFSPRFVAICLLGEPVVATLLGLAYFGEAVPLTTLAGGAILLVAIYLAAAGERRAR